MSNPNNNLKILLTINIMISVKQKNKKNCEDNKSLSLFPLTTCSLLKNFDHLQLLIQSTYIDFDVTAIAESRTI